MDRIASDDTVERIKAYNADREPERLEIKYATMRTNAFAYYRGTCHLFYEDWPKETPLDAAPPAWICGDLHLENFGSYKGDNRLPYFDLNDFDEACLAPATWELARFVTSLYLACDSFGLEHSDAKTLSVAFLEAYASALRDGKARWVERATAQGLIRMLLHDVKKRTRRDLLDTMTTGRRHGRKFVIDGKHRLKAARGDRTVVSACLTMFSESESCPAHYQGNFFRVLDVARRIAGTGSLGIQRFAVLVEGRGGPDGNFVIDLKEARPSALAPRLTVPQPAWASQATRVVAVQQRAEAIGPALLFPVTLARAPFVLKELQPAIDRLTLDAENVGTLAEIVGAMGHVVAWSHLRSGGRQGAATTDTWQAFGDERWWIRDTLAYARRYHDTVRTDYKAYCAAYDGGSFNSKGA